MALRNVGCAKRTKGLRFLGPSLSIIKPSPEMKNADFPVVQLKTGQSSMADSQRRRWKKN
jgi:hypothetical protein